MLTKNSDAASADANAKTKHTRKADEDDKTKNAVSLTAVAHEPKADWVPLVSAPLRYSSLGYIRSVEKWRENLDVKVKQFAQSISPDDDIHMPEYSFQSTRKWDAWIEAGGITTHLSANWGAVYVSSGKDFLAGGDPDELLKNKIWKNFPPQQMSAARWHRNLLKAILKSLRRDFGEALNKGSAHVMARKNTVLAPFERVSWDQWQYFKLDEPDQIRPEWEEQYYEWRQPASPPLHWFDPRNCGWEAKGYRPSTATGPSGERLYAIHVAPGSGRAESGNLSPEEKCIQWLVQSMTAFPERSPKKREALLEEAVTLFPGLTERGFGRCLFDARRQTGNLKWMTSGRRPKSPR
jgi:hypothetical protein